MEATLCIVAGEASGDLLGAKLSASLKQKAPNLTLTGMGGKQMQKAGVTLWLNSEELAFVGLMDVLKNLNTLRRAMKTMVDALRKNPPDLLILIDYPGFNLRLAKHAKKLGIKILYYSCPQIWAWHYSRIHKIKRYIDHMAVLFPFEETLYQKENMPVTFVGHPLVDSLRPDITRQDAATYCHLNPNHPIIGLFPGSRHSEINMLLPIMLEACALIKNDLPTAQFVLPIAPNLKKQTIEAFTHQNITLIENNIENVLAVCDTAIVTSGTATLEVALNQIPLLIIYKASAFNYFIGKRVITLDRMGLCNLVAEEDIAREFIQHDATPHAIAQETLALLNNTHYRQACFTKMARLKAKLSTQQCSQKAADLSIALLKKTP